MGRQTHEINGEKERASGRLDILFKNRDQNLFVVETKPQDQKLSEEDKEQAISYARLLKQIKFKENMWEITGLIGKLSSKKEKCVKT